MKSLSNHSLENNKCHKISLERHVILYSILVPPQIISHSPEHMRMTVRENRSARFSCIATGRPAPIIVWHVNGLSRPATVTMGM
jgi:hypothetical protein